MYNSNGTTVPVTAAATGTIEIHEGNFGYQGVMGKVIPNPGYEASIYAKADGAVQTILLDMGGFAFPENKIGTLFKRTIYPALDFAYCAPTLARTQVTVPESSPESYLVAAVVPSLAPIEAAGTSSSVPQPTPAPVEATVASSSSLEMALASIHSPMIAPTRAPSQYCNEIIGGSKYACVVCEPFRSPDYCEPDESFATLVHARTKLARGDPEQLKYDNYWFNILEDKVAGYLLSIDQNMPAPQIYCCATDIDELGLCLDEVGVKCGDHFQLPPGEGIVIKATNLHSNQNVFILVNDTIINNPDDLALDLLTNTTKAYADVATELMSKALLTDTKFIVEKFIGSSLPDEYKLHVVDGKVQAIDIIQGRGTDCPCYAVVDTDWGRLDYNGCFEPAGVGHVDHDTQCTEIDFDSGRRKAGPIKKDMYLCDTISEPEQCVIDDMIAIAETLAATIGVYMRVDMFVSENQVFVQEYSPNPMNGLRHCASKTTADSCIDSRFLGREWKAAGGGVYGGYATETPPSLIGYLDKSATDQCALTINSAYTNNYPSSCGV